MTVNVQTVNDYLPASAAYVICSL